LTLPPSRNAFSVSRAASPACRDPSTPILAIHSWLESSPSFFSPENDFIHSAIAGALAAWSPPCAAALAALVAAALAALVAALVAAAGRRCHKEILLLTTAAAGASPAAAALVAFRHAPERRKAPQSARRAGARQQSPPIHDHCPPPQMPDPRRIELQKI
jgi:hypothetical protein